MLRNVNHLFAFAHFHLLLPAMKLWQGYVFTCVCDSVHRGESASVHAGIAEPPRSRLPRSRPSRSRHPTRSRHPQEQIPSCTVHAGRYSQQAGGMHSTGMHTCSNLILFNNSKYMYHVEWLFVPFTNSKPKTSNNVSEFMHSNWIMLSYYSSPKHRESASQLLLSCTQ